MDSAVATCLKAVTVPSVVPIQWTKSVDLFFCFFCPHPCPSNIPSPPLPSHWAPVFESCSLSRLTELTKSKEGIWRWVGVGHGKKKKKNKVMEWKGGEQRGSTKKAESEEAALCDPHRGHKWQRQAASAVLLLKDLSPSSHPARPAWQRPFCPFSYNDSALPFPEQCIIGLCLALICIIKEAWCGR